MERLLSRINRDRLHVVVFDDIVSRPGSVGRGIMRFPGLDEGYDVPLPHRNSAPVRRSKLLHRAVQASGKTKQALGISAKFGILNQIKRRNIRPCRRKPASVELRREMTEVFASDVDKLSRLIDRDLSEWLVIEKAGQRS